MMMLMTDHNDSVQLRTLIIVMTTIMMIGWLVISLHKGGRIIVYRYHI